MSEQPTRPAHGTVAVRSLRAVAGTRSANSGGRASLAPGHKRRRAGGQSTSAEPRAAATITAIAPVALADVRADRAVWTGSDATIRRRRWDVATAAAMLLTLVIGCYPVAQTIDSSADRPNRSSPVRPDEHLTAHQQWEVIQIAGQTVGSTHTEWDAESAGAGETVTSRTELSLERFGQQVRQVLTWTGRVRPDGMLSDFEATLEGGAEATRVRGFVEGNTLVVETESAGHVSRARFPAGELGGLAGIQRDLLRRPMAPGDSRTLHVLAPVFFQPVEVHLHARQWEETELLEESEQLLRIDSVTQLPDDQRLETALWVGGDNWIRKTRTVTGWTQETFAVSGPPRHGQVDKPLDLGRLSLIAVRPSLSEPHRRRRIRYRVITGDAELLERFNQGPRQHRADGDPTGTLFDVYASWAVAPTERDERPSEDNLRSNAIVQSDDPVIRKLADEARSEAADEAALVELLEKRVFEWIEAKDFSQAMASAAQVVRTREGDCTEHAVLLAALCRACGIPARLAVGIVYDASSKAFAYHMWTEAWVESSWRPLDATVAMGGIGPAHLKLFDTNLADGNAYGALLPVLDLLGRLELEVVEVE